jgi:hypothetical protein
MCSLLCRFAARLLAWFLSRVLAASVGFRVAGFNCLRDVTIKFHKVCFSSHAAEALELYEVYDCQYFVFNSFY